MMEVNASWQKLEETKRRDAEEAKRAKMREIERLWVNPNAFAARACV